MNIQSSYLKVLQEDWEDRIVKLYSILESCTLCPRVCKLNRIKGERGYCKSGKELLISSIGPHFGEEQPLVGKRGSGTIFLTNCNLGCVYCQNYDISHFGRGKSMSTDELSKRMVELQNVGCHNINFVTPTHFVPQLVESCRIAVGRGLKIPIVYNCSGYESIDTIKLLGGIIDIYMPDIKYGDDIHAKKFSDAPDYFERCREVIKEMHRQVGDLQTQRGIAQRGLLIRHLVLPNRMASSEKILEFISREISKDSYVNIMFQYHPEYSACRYQELNRSPTLNEFDEVIEIAKNYGLHRGFQRDLMFRL